MLASELFRALIALGFLLLLQWPVTALLYGLSALLMVATPFFTACWSSILPDLATRRRAAHGQCHDANDLVG
jgi:hypothetical protein